MKSESMNYQAQSPYNKAVQIAYYHILKQAKQMLATVEQEELMFTLERECKAQSTIGTIVHELVNPLVYLRLEHHTDDQLAIHFGIECVNKRGQLADLTSRFLRLFYKVTTHGAYPVDIEDCIKTDWFINSCSEMYEYVEQRNKHHIFKHIKYKVTAQKRKQMLSVA